MKGKLLEMDIREVERGRIEDIMEMQDDQQMEENNNQDEEMQDVNTRFETSFPLLDNVLRYDDELDLEVSNIDNSCSFFWGL